MEVAMLELIVGVGIILVLLLLVKLLEYFDLFDILELFGAIARLVTGAIALLASLLQWSARKVAGARAKPTPVEKAPVPPGSVQARGTARYGRGRSSAWSSGHAGPQRSDRTS
jgi:hypothetical protein